MQMTKLVRKPRRITLIFLHSLLQESKSKMTQVYKYATYSQKLGSTKILLRIDELHGWHDNRVLGRKGQAKSCCSFFRSRHMLFHNGIQVQFCSSLAHVEEGKSVSASSVSFNCAKRFHFTCLRALRDHSPKAAETGTKKRN